MICLELDHGIVDASDKIYDLQHSDDKRQYKGLKFKGILFCYCYNTTCTLLICIVKHLIFVKWGIFMKQNNVVACLLSDVAIKFKIYRKLWTYDWLVWLSV